MHKLLIVEDSPKERLMYQHVIDCYQLFTGNHQSLGSCDSLNFLKQCQQNPVSWPDVMLLDLDMTESCGWNFLDEFERLMATIHKKVDVYIVSSSISGADQLRISKMAFIKDQFLKPVSRHALLALHQLYECSGGKIAS
ncbi:response regulator [Mucilaginibacter myungsuensis]|uniref:Response regulatory domain-containing protein n=1 Tax=Mucilaginibacter myungsuensis TaxID=649104 RepID=A0A929PWI4_9SPHI|nr:hypothetical protein [Mucilaginibacter myungsuensis]MBE9662868.1 hypothetical protein [Mucilaginibacter myungsuensis]MDN3598288.1 hypothetical protein [Mucilaginibacter myungsuensis]